MGVLSGDMQVGPLGDCSAPVLKDFFLDYAFNPDNITNILWIEGDLDMASACDGPPRDESGRLRDGWDIGNHAFAGTYYFASEPMTHPYDKDRLFYVVANSDGCNWVYGVADLKSIEAFGVRESVYVGEPT